MTCVFLFFCYSKEEKIVALNFPYDLLVSQFVFQIKMCITVLQNETK